MSYDANAAKTAIYGALAADTTLTAMLAGTASVYDSRAPQGAQLPYVIFQQATGLPSYTFTGRAWEDCIFTIKAVTEGDSAQAAGSIATRIHDVLQDAALSIGGTDALYVRREANVDYPESSEGKTYRHLGAQWRVWTP